jgi:hypothetical protein
VGLDRPDHPLEFGPGVAPQQRLAVESRRVRELLPDGEARKPRLIVEPILGDRRRIGIFGRARVIVPSGLGLVVAPGPVVGPLSALTLCAIFVPTAIRILASGILTGLGRLGSVGLNGAVGRIGGILGGRCG